MLRSVLPSRAAAAAVLAVLLAACEPPTRAAVYDRPILFESTREGAPDTGLFLGSADGLHVAKLGGVGPRPAQPSWSPNGRRIAFTSPPFDAPHLPHRQVFILRFDGTAPVPLTEPAHGAQHPAWSPDGSRVAFVGARSPLGASVYIVPANGGTPRRLRNTLHAEVKPISWSPDGRWIAYSWGTSLFLTDTTGTRTVRLGPPRPCGDQHPAWSPDGARIAFSACELGSSAGTAASRGIYLMNADGSGRERLTADSLHAWAPSFSPDGGTLVFAATGANGGEMDVHVMPSSGGEPRNITQGLGGHSGLPRWNPAAAAPEP